MSDNKLLLRDPRPLSPPPRAAGFFYCLQYRKKAAAKNHSTLFVLIRHIRSELSVAHLWRGALRMSTALAEVIKDPVIAVPSCAQCKTQMVLQRIEPDPVTGRD